MSFVADTALRTAIDESAKRSGTTRSRFVRAALELATAQTLTGRMLLVNGELQPKGR